MRDDVATPTPMNIRCALVLLVSALVSSAALAQSGKPDAEGYIRNWLVLAPLTIGDSPGSDEIDKKQFAEEAQPAAKDGAVQKIGGEDLKWKKVETKAFYIDFRELNPTQGEHVVGWAVAYLVAEAEKTKLTLKMNSNDQGKVYLNGKEVIKFTETRTLEKEAEDTAIDVTLKKGVNVLVLKVVNEENNWQGSVRFLDAAGKPVTDVKVETKP